MVNQPEITLVGSDTLLGREVRDLAATATARTTAVDRGGQEKAGLLTRQGDEPAVVQELTEESLADARVVVLAGSAESSRKALEMAGENTDFAIVDLTYAAEERPDARLRQSLLESPETFEEEAEKQR